MKKVGRPTGRNPLLSTRLDPVLFGYLQRAAKTNQRTVAAEVAFRLTKSMIEDGLRNRYAPAPSEEDAA